MLNNENGAIVVGLKSDQGEEGWTYRIKDVLQPFTREVTGGSTIVGFSSDEGVRRNHGRVGAAGGPNAIRGMLARLPVHRMIPIFDAGDIECLDGDLEAAQEKLASYLAMLLGHGALPVVLGGGHEVAYASFLGLAKHLGDRLTSTDILVINLDAHFDLRVAEQPNSGTPFRQIAELCTSQGVNFRYLCVGVSELANTSALFARADALGVEYWVDEDVSKISLKTLREELRARISRVHKVYLSIDLDVLPGAVAPGVSAPAARGIALEIVEELVDEVLSSGRLALADIAEMNPAFDFDDQTARVAARLAYRLMVGPRMQWRCTRD